MYAYDSFYSYLIHALNEFNNSATKFSDRNFSADVVGELERIAKDKQRQKIFLAHLDSVKTMAGLNSLYQPNSSKDQDFLGFVSFSSYNDIPLFEQMLSTSDKQGKDFLQAILPKINIFNNSIIKREENNSSSLLPSAGSFTELLAQAIKASLPHPQPTLTLGKLRTILVNLGKKEYESLRIKLIHKISELAKPTLLTQRSFDVNDTDPIFLNLLGFNNYRFLLLHYLPLSHDDDINNPTYSGISQKYVSIENPSNKMLSAKPIVIKSTKPQTIKVSARNAKPLYALIGEIYAELQPNNKMKFSDANTVKQKILGLSDSHKKSFIAKLQLLVATHVYQQENSNEYLDKKFLENAKCNNYAFFLNECFPNATNFDKYLFSQLGAMAPSIDEVARYNNKTDQTSSFSRALTNNPVVNAVKDVISYFFSPVKKLSPQENIAYFNEQKSTMLS